jgi:pyruvate formate-lyase activating enzyme-like uncharacterized protein
MVAGDQTRGFRLGRNIPQSFGKRLRPTCVEKMHRHLYTRGAPDQAQRMAQVVEVGAAAARYHGPETHRHGRIGRERAETLRRAQNRRARADAYPAAD